MGRIRQKTAALLKSTRERSKFIFLMLLFFFILRIIVIFFFSKANGDCYFYSNYALTLLEGTKWLYSSDFIGSYREPGYPIFLAFIYFIFGKENFLAVYILQCLLSTATIFIIYRLAAAIFDKRTAFIAFIWSGFYIYYIWSACRILRETLVIFLFILLFYLLYRYLNLPDEKRKAIYLISSASIYFFLIHTDSRYLYLILPIPMIFTIYLSFRKGVKNFLIFLCLVIILSTPWAIRNYIVYKNFVLISTFHFKPSNNLFMSFKHWKWLFTFKDEREILSKTVLNANEQDYPLQKKQELIKTALQLPKTATAEAFIVGTFKTLDAELYPFYYSSLQFKWLSLKKLLTPVMLQKVFIVNSYSGTGFSLMKYRQWPLIYNILSFACYGTMLPFALAGVIMLLRQKNKVTIFFLLPLIFHIFLHTIGSGLPRYRFPVDSFLIILGAYGMSFTYSFFTRHIKKQPYKNYYTKPSEGR